MAPALASGRFGILIGPFAASMAHGLRMVVNLVVVKMIAVLIGPSGMGALGNLMSVTTMASVFAGGGISNGISKYVAEYQARPLRMVRFISSAIVYGGLFSILFLIVTIVASGPISILLFDTALYRWLVPCIGVAQMLCFVGTATIAVVNGQHRPDLFAIIAIAAYIGCIPAAYILIYFFRFEGAALALLLSIACTAAPALWLIIRSKWIRFLKMKLAKQDLLGMSKFSLMALASAVLFPTTEIIIRTQIIANLGLEQAGLWQAMSRLSGAYLGFFTLYLAATYMPKLSAQVHRNTIVSTVYRYLAIVVGGFAIAALAIYLLRDLIIQMLFSSAFQPMEVLFPWQLLGDLFRVGAYVIGFLVVAKAALKLHLAAEIAQCLIYGATSSLILAHGGGIEDVQKGYAFTYAAYFVLTWASLQIYRARAPR